MSLMRQQQAKGDVIAVVGNSRPAELMAVEEVATSVPQLQNAQVGGGTIAKPVRDPFRTFLKKLWRALQEIILHFIITVVVIGSLACIDLFLHYVGFSQKFIPLTTVTISDWMSFLEVAAATGIIGIGIIKTLRASWRRR